MIALIHNLALLVSLSVISGFVGQRVGGGRRGAVVQGLLFGGVAVVSMLAPLALESGIQFDSRSVAVSICGLYFGPAAAAIAGIVAAVYRVAVGGPGMVTGLLVIVASGALGAVAHRWWRIRPVDLSSGRIWLFGLVVHAVMLLVLFTLPDGRVWQVLETVGLPIMLFYPLATVLIGGILTAQHAQMHYIGELRQSIEQFRTTLYSIGDGVITTDKNGRIREMNPVAEKLTGWTEKEVRGRPLESVFVIVNESTRAAVENPAHRVLRDGRTVGLANHTLLVARDGSECPIADSGAPIHDAKGRMTGVVLVFRDGSEERAANRALRDARERFERALAHIPDVVVIYDRDLRVQYVNEATQTISGRSAAEFVGKGDEEIWWSQTCSSYLPLLREALESREIRSIETGLDIWGRRRTLHITYVPVLDDAGDVLEILGIARDLTERRLSEAALRESEKRFRSVFDLQFQFMAILSRTGRILEINNLLLRTGDVTRRDVLGKRVWEAPWWRDLPEMRENWPNRLKEAAAATGPVVTLDQYQEASGAVRVADAAVTAVRDSAGRLTCFILQGNDVTERQEARDALVAAKQVLEKIFDSLSEAVLLIDSETRTIIQCNPAVERVFGYAPDELVGQSDRILHINDENYEEIGVLSSAALEAKTTFRAEYLLRQKSGATIDTELTVALVHGDGTAGGRVVCVIRDSTARKRTEAALRKSEALLRIAGHVAQIGGWIIDLPEGRVTWSDEVRAIHEQPSEYVPTFEEGLRHFPPEWRGKVAEALEACKRDGTPFDLELQLITAHGRRTWIRAIGQAVRDESGAVTRVQGAFQDISKLKDFESSLAQSQARFRELADSMPLIVWTADADGYVDYASEALARYSGRPSDGDPGADWIQVICPDDLADTGAAWREALRRGDRYVDEIRIQRRDGVYRWNHVRAIPVRDESGAIVKWYGTATDIHDIKLNEETMTQMAARLTATLESITDAFYTLDRNWRFTYMNSEAERLLRRPKEELLGQMAGKVFEEPVGSEVDENFSRAMRDNCSVHFETFYERLNCWFELHLYPSDEGLAVYFRDITERVEAERELRAVTGRLQSILDFSPLLITETDLEGRYLLANKAACEAMDRPAGGMDGKSVFDLLPEEAATRLARRLAVVVGERASRTVEDSITIGGVDRTFSTVLFPLFDAEGAVSSVGGIAQEITEQKNAEAERDKLEAQLRQAQKLEAIGRLAGGVAHDFNNMLGVILGYTEMALLNLPKDDPLASDLEQVQLAATRSSDLTRQLLAFARKQTIAPQVLDINQTVESILKMLGRLIGEDIDLVWKPGSHVWPIRLDPTQLDQILANLAVNARDAINGIGRLTITTATETFDASDCKENDGTAPGDFVSLSVADDGCGIDEQTLAQIFEPFFTTKPHGRGTGLGLATVYGIVKQNNGFITVDSEVGKGSTFTIRFPRYEASADPQQEVLRPPQAQTGSETVLLVEDEWALLNLGKRLLERLGYTVLAAGSPADALRVSRSFSGHIDLLITDIIMPGMNGHDLWRELDGLRPGIKTLFMSGYTADVIATHGALDQGVHFLQKPFKMETMAEKVREALSDESAINVP